MLDAIYDTLCLSVPFMFGIIVGRQFKRERHPVEHMIDGVRKRCRWVGADERWEVSTTGVLHRKGELPIYIRVGTTEA